VLAEQQHVKGKDVQVEGAHVPESQDLVRQKDKKKTLQGKYGYRDPYWHIIRVRINTLPTTFIHYRS
jgi:hypothetical protein